MARIATKVAIEIGIIVGVGAELYTNSVEIGMISAGLAFMFTWFVAYFGF